MLAPPYDDAPCGLLLLRLDGTVLAANRTFCAWTGRTAAELASLRLPELLSVGGRIYWETHLSPLLHVDRRVDEVALELTGPDGRRPVLLSATVGADDLVRAAVCESRERTRYERELLAARAAADVAAARLTALQAVTAALSRALGLSAVAGALLDAAVGPLGAEAATLWLPSDDGLRPYAARGEQPDADRPPEDADGLRSVPLPGARAVQGVLTLRARTSAGTDPVDPELLVSVGQQAGLALDRAILHEQSAGVAHELQHALLAVDPPVDTRFSVATTYRAGIEMLEVGGDWYDVFLAEEGVLSVVVGDVVGRGLAAASAMGQLRSATRAVSDAGRSPAAVLEQLDRFVEQVPAAAFATVVHAQLDLATGLVRLACAGHPPPVLVPRSAPARLVWGGRSTPLGALVTPHHSRTDTTVQLAPGDRMLLYTDGLVERRDAGLDERLDLLERVSADLVGPALDRAVEGLVARLLVDEQHRDDVCVLLLEWAGPVFERRLPADLRTLAEVRHDLRRWLADRGLDHRMADDVVLATSEALANAAEHGGGGQSSERVHLQVRVEQDPERGSEVVVRVTDTGQWRSATSSTERGRGLTIARALVDDVVVETGDGTSVLLRRRLTAAEAS